MNMAESDFGLDENELDQCLAFYRRLYNIPCKKSNPHLQAQQQPAEESL